MTALPTTTRQVYRQLQMPPFKNLAGETTEQILVIKPELAGEFPVAQGSEPPVGYGLELFSIYHPFYLATRLVEHSGAEELATQFSIISRMTLTRRGVLIWEGSPSVTSMVIGNKNQAHYSLFIGGWGGQFQSPPVIQSPGELSISTSVLMTAHNPEIENPKWEYILLGEESALFANSYITGFIGQGAIGYGLVAL